MFKWPLFDSGSFKSDAGIEVGATVTLTMLLFSITFFRVPSLVTVTGVAGSISMLFIFR